MLVFGLMAASASAQDSSIRGFVKYIDGKQAAQAEVKVERVDAKARSITIKTDAKGNYAATGLPVGTFKVTAYVKDVAKEVGGINTKSGTSITVDFDLAAKPSSKQEKRYVWVKAELGSRIGGRWQEVNEALGPGIAPIVKMGREDAIKSFGDAHSRHDAGR